MSGPGMLRPRIGHPVPPRVAVHVQKILGNNEFVARLARGMLVATHVMSRRALDGGGREAVGVAGGSERMGEAAMLQELRQSIRSLRHDTTFTVPAATVLTVGFAIGASVLAVARAYLFRPLPFPRADRIMAVNWSGGSEEVDLPASLAQLNWVEISGVLDRAVSVNRDVMTLVGAAGAEQASGAWVSPDFFDVFAARMAAGRAFRQVPQGAMEAVISYGLWQRRFAGDPAAVGTAVRIHSIEDPGNIELATIVGVLPADFWYFDQFFEVLLPARQPVLPTFVRLKDGVRPADAASRLAAAARELGGITNAGWRVEVVPVRDRATSRIRPVLTFLLGAVVLVVLIAGANVAMLYLVHLDRKGADLAIRRALGAKETHVALHLATETALLAVGSAVLGFWLSWAGMPAAANAIQRQLNLAAPGGASAFRPDATVALIAVPVLGLLAGLLAIIPVTISGRRDLLASLRQSVAAPSTAGGRSLRGGLIVVQVAISLALVINCGLMIASAYRLRHIDVGFAAGGLGVGRLSLPDSRYAGEGRLVGFFDELLAHLRDHGVRQAAVVSHAPFRSARANVRRFQTVAADGSIVMQDASTLHVSPGFFETMRIPVVTGELFRDERDAAVVSVSFANRAWPGERGLGKTIRSGDDLELTVVGIVGEVLNSLTDTDLPDVYVPMIRSPWPSVEVIARTGNSGPTAVAALRRAVTELDADLPLGRGESMSETIGRQTGRSDFLAVLLLLFGATAVALVVVALYGSVAYAVSQRSREIAVRAAFGGTPGNIAALFLRWGLLRVGLGVAVGLVSAIFLSRTLAGQLHGVTATEPWLYAALCGLLISVALAAVWLPARRAGRIDPMVILRGE